MSRLTFFLISMTAGLFLTAQNRPPQITNLFVTADTNLKKMNVTYDLTDNESDDVKITIKLSDDDGKTFSSPISNVSGDQGFPVTPGNSKFLSFSYSAALPLENALVRLIADDLHPVNIQDLVDQVDTNFLRTDLSLIEGVRHYLGNPTHLEETKNLIENRFRQAGLQTSRQEFQHVGYNAANILGRMPGNVDETLTYIIDGHFDSVEDSPGADDNGSAVAGVLEALRILSKYGFKNSIRFIGFDFEETSSALGGLTGSLKYVGSGIESYDSIVGVINFEMIGYYSEKINSQQAPAGFNTLFPTQYAALQADNFRGNFITNVADANSAWLKNAFDSCAAAYVPDLKVISIGIPAGLFVLDLMRSDHASFWSDTISALMLTDGANFRNVNYHTPKDTMGALNFTFMGNVVKAAVATIAKHAGVQNSSSASFDLIPTSVPEIPVRDCLVQIVPNPAKGFVDIFTGECFSKNATVSIFNAAGRLVQQSEIQNQKTFHTNTLKFSPGLYIALIGNEKQCVTKEFIVE